MAAFNFNFLVFTAILVATMVSGGFGTHTLHWVGEDYGWHMPTTADFYTNWVSRQIFTVGDSIHFEFPPGKENVVEVTKEGYDHCYANEGASVVKTSATTFNLTEPGDHYYISTMEGRCQFHMKLAINVCPAATSTATPPVGWK